MTTDRGPYVDFHAHFMPEGSMPGEADGSVHGLTGPGYWVGPERRLADMDRAGIDVQVVSGAPPLYRYDLTVSDALPFCRDLNDELATWHERWPGRFLGLANLPMQDPDAAVDELERTAALGMVGAVVGTHVNGTNWDDPRLRPVLRAACELDLMVFFHPAHRRVQPEAVASYHLLNLIGNPLETTIAIASIIYGGVLEELPELRLLFAHAGGFGPADVGRFDHGHRVRPEARSAISRSPSSYLGQLFVDCISHGGHALRLALDLVGETQVVVGSDYPADMGLEDPVGWLRDTVGAEAAERIARANATALLGRRGAAVLTGSLA